MKKVTLFALIVLIGTDNCIKLVDFRTCKSNENYPYFHNDALNETGICFDFSSNICKLTKLEISSVAQWKIQKPFNEFSRQIYILLNWPTNVLLNQNVWVLRPNMNVSPNNESTAYFMHLNS
ncbi:hypothetical protein N9R54_04730 [Pelobium sp.]|nr:hypothetical protein [Pelobium sp.]MDA9555521.1 hypothetical protein [Pelobium sp.]